MKVNYTVRIACSGKLTENQRTYGERMAYVRETQGKREENLGESWRTRETICMGKPEVRLGEQGMKSIGEHAGLLSVEGMNVRERTPNVWTMEGQTDVEMHECKHGKCGV